PDHQEADKGEDCTGTAEAETLSRSVRRRTDEGIRRAELLQVLAAVFDFGLQCLPHHDSNDGRTVPNLVPACADFQTAAQGADDNVNF
ncbi:MAG: hypothetical protein IJ741_06915, partial [Schwartzia sp.]|nr:hypothetical protein [Schwartzia sp. (in: firmicutes)]